MEYQALPVDQPREMKPYKCFSVDLNLNTQFLQEYLVSKYRELQDADTLGKLGQTIRSGQIEERMWESSGSLSTVAWRDYNVFQYHEANLYDLLRALSGLTREACDHYGLNFEKQRYMVQGWFNINTKSSGKLDWHIHSELGAPHFHGYYCVNAEPSSTWYQVGQSEITEVVNKNNRAILGESRFPHAMGDWDWDGNRITVAYDISPLRALQKEYEQHYVPLP
jgi:hypothetical protein